MKKSFLAVTAIVLGFALHAQQKQKHALPPPPPPPPVVDTKNIPPPPPPRPPKIDQGPSVPPSPPKVVGLPEDYKAFLKKNPGVSSLAWMRDNKVAVYLKSGAKELYDLNNEGELKSVEFKYGKLPAAPPPPPPPPVEN